MNNILLDAISTITDTDSYKFSHWLQYPPKTKGMYSYFESRGGRYKQTTFFGLQYYIKSFLTTKITMNMVNEAAEFAVLHGVPFNYEGWSFIAKELDGKLPVRIKAVPEGMSIPVHNILLSVESTRSEDEIETFWIVSWLETMLVRLWYSCVVSTNSLECRKVITRLLQQTSDDPENEIDFKLHDFGARGTTCREAAMIGGASHLVHFKGSDTIAGIIMANKFYNENMAGYSIPASEHSTMTMWGRENEIAAYRNMIKQYGDGPIFACVSDSYDIYNAAENIWGEELKQEVLNMNATLVVRPDSGDPCSVVMKLLQILDKKFGHTINSKNYKVLNKVRIIQGDGIDIHDVATILTTAKDLGYSSTNITFGMGGGLLQKDLNRDTNKFAFKCSWALVDGKFMDVYKDPLEASDKKSKKGKLDLVYQQEEETGRIFVKTVAAGETDWPSLLEVVYENGELKKEYSFTEVRANAQICVEQA